MNEDSQLIDKLKSDFKLTLDLSDVTFRKCKLKKYHNYYHENFFGEKLSVIYTMDFTIYNVQFSMKILAFTYENSSEILKLDIDIPDKQVEKEIASCRNFLQRHRNLIGTFTTLIEFSKFLETRRLILMILLSKVPGISSERQDDGALLIKYIRQMPGADNIYIAIGWKIDWDLKSCTVVDVIEVYYNNINLPNDEIKKYLIAITQPSLSFHEKFKLWKGLITSLQAYDSPTIQAVITIKETPTMVSEADGVLVISDNEEDCEILDVTRSKRRKMDSPTSSAVHVIPD